MDQDGDAQLTAEEEAELSGFDMQWIEGFNGDLVGSLDGVPLDLGGPQAATATMPEARSSPPTAARWRARRSSLARCCR